MAASHSAAAAGSNKSLPAHLRAQQSALEEDQFEEFEQEDWNEKQAEAIADPTLWESSWDNDKLDDEFAARLREQQAAVTAKTQTSKPP